MPATLDQTAIADAYAEALEEFSAGRDDIVTTYVHADGSRTFIVRDDSSDHESPRDDAGNVATLINESRDFVDLDEDSTGLAEAREHFSGRPEMMRRYLAMWRPDIAHYEERWEVTGYSQGEWQYGWGYVTAEAMEATGAAAYRVDPDGGGTSTLLDWEGNPQEYHVPNELIAQRQAEGCFRQELATYELHFRGDYLGGIHVTMGEPVVEVDFTGAELVSVELKEESVWGFLGYDDTRDIAATFTDSDIVGEE